MAIKIINADNEKGLGEVIALRDMLRKGELAAAAEQLDIPKIVSDIIDDITNRGDIAAAELTNKLDNADIEPENLRVPIDKIKQAHQQAEPEFIELIRKVSANIREYQESILVPDPPMLERDGRKLGVKYTPIDRVGVYIPGGQAIYPSSVLMTIVPALVACVPEIAICSPPRTDGDINPMVLALSGELGIDEVYRIGGAQGIAALSIGTETIKPVNKIVGPGNAFVAEAKKQVLGTVGIDSIAGPSEVLIIADDTARADWIAADLIAQAEHNPGSGILVTPSQKLAKAVADELETQLPKLERESEARTCLQQYSAAIVSESLEQAIEIANDFATEHLEIITADDNSVCDKIRNAGAIFLGQYTTVPLGDYYAGPSHVLPTGGTAKFFGPLSCNEFRKASSILQYDEKSLKTDADAVIDFATRAGLTAHANAVRIRTY